MNNLISGDLVRDPVDKRRHFSVHGGSLWTTWDQSPGDYPDDLLRVVGDDGDQWAAGVTLKSKMFIK